LGGTAAVVVALDQITKEIALRTLDDGPVDLIEGALTLRLTFNSGGAFGVGEGFPQLFLAATVGIVALILFWARNLEKRSWIVALGMVMGGGIGNVSDRLFRGHDGRVVDFVDLHVWPVFNVADSAIVAGVALIFLLGLRSDEQEGET
jgi:signal peptidase II